GDRIVAIAGPPVHDWTQMGQVIRRQPPGKPVTVTVQRGGQQLTLHPSLAVVSGRHGSYLGISPVIVFQRSGPLGGVGYAGSQFGQIGAGAAGGVGSLPKAIPDRFAPNRARTPSAHANDVTAAPAPTA